MRLKPPLLSISVGGGYIHKKLEEKIKELMELLPKRSRASITGRKHLLGITSRTIHNWTEEEKDICRQWLSLPDNERPSKQSLAEKIPDHTKNGIKDMLKRLQKEII